MLFIIFLIVMIILFFGLCVGETQVLSKAFKEKDYEKIKLELFCIAVVVIILIIMQYSA